MKTVFDLPEPAHEVRLAHWLLGNQSRIELRIMETLVGTPQRFRDLRAQLIHGKTDTPLTRGLKRLGDRGLIRQGMNLDNPTDPRYYALTSLGILVVLKTHEMKPIGAVLDEARRAGILNP